MGTLVPTLSRKPVGCVLAAGRSLDHGQDRGPHADEDDAEQQQKQAADEELAAADRGVDDGELADERAERGRAGDGEEAGQEQAPRERQRAGWRRGRRR